MSSIIQRCGHCGNTASFTRAASGSQPLQITDQERAVTKWTTWRVLLCSTCTQPTLERDVQEIPGPLGPPPTRSRGPEILYPLQRIARWRDVLPPPVYKLYTDVLSVEKHSARACATVVGVTLEAICQVEQAQGSSLSEQLNDLASSGRIPTIINQMAQHLRYLRNIGVHMTHETVTEEDIPILLEVLEAILEYLYVFPATMRALQTRVETKGGI